MAGKITLWVTLVAACIAADGAGVAGALRKRQPPQVDGDPPSCSLTLPQIIYFPDDEGKLQPAIMYGHEYYVEATKDDVYFTLFTSLNPDVGQPLKLGDKEQLRRSHFDVHETTVFVTHGFLSSAKAEGVTGIKNMYVHNNPFNVITVDWSKISKNPIYWVVKKQTIFVGGVVAQFLIFLNEAGYRDLGRVHLVGHSLGAHVMGIAAKEFKNETNNVGRVTGLDPAGYCYDPDEKDVRLDREDAEFVDVIHTCGGTLGMKESIGSVDFFPNGGVSPQPGCTVIDKDRCSHSRVWDLYKESISSTYFTSIPCRSYDDFKHNRNCNINLWAPMGEHAPAWITGNYYLDTAASSPYALGQLFH
ncbi:pancreatic lipase-related protein 2-like isoform X2 [Ischnura elegans]|uniref:pancreatic lipase-related protein 2-like isoform X2 n=1 Tax=Ischnura elegans TaxID=197161 RepID=UPI001ED878F7|nr:pancreatic lipase-related protein 2-like isoform X2 [Ischnura elegans]